MGKDDAIRARRAMRGKRTRVPAPAFGCLVIAAGLGATGVVKAQYIGQPGFGAETSRAQPDIGPADVGQSGVAGEAAARRPPRYVQPSVGVEILWTDNANYSASGTAQSDIVTNLSGSLTFHSDARRVRVNGFVGLNVIDYLDNTATDRIMPMANVNAVVEAIENYFFIDSGIVVTQTALDFFGVRPGQGSTVNSVTTTQYRVTPLIEGRLSEAVTYRLRSDNTWTTSSQSDAGTIDDSYLGQHVASIQRAPLPLGGFASLSSTATKYNQRNEPALRSDIARVGVDYAVTPLLSVGLRVGRERTEGVVESVDDRLYGGQLDWRPSERTSLNGFYENRFFGDSWQGQFSHRRPRFAAEVASSRGLSTFPNLLLSLPATNNLAGLIDASLRTRIPDPNARAEAVQEFFTATGLPNSLASPVNLYNERVLLASRTTATFVLLGIRNSLSMSAFAAKNQDLASVVPAVVPPDTSLQSNNNERGVGISFSHRLSPQITTALTADRSRMEGLGAASDQSSTQLRLRLQVNYAVSPKTNAVAGVRRLTLDSNVTVDTRENAIFVAATHYF